MEAEKKIDGVKEARLKAEALNQKLLDEKREMEELLAKGDTAVREMESKTKKIENERKHLDKEVRTYVQLSGWIVRRILSN